MNENIGANYSDMQQAVTLYNQQVQAFEQALSQLANSIETLGASWRGNGYQAFRTTAETWKADATKMNNDLAAISQQVHTSTGIFQETDQQIASGFGRL